MNKVKLGDICKITSSKRVHESDYVENGIPFIRGLEITDGSIGKSDTRYECYISEDFYQEIKSKYGAPITGDILITSVGTIGNLYQVEKDFDFYFKDGNVIRFTDFAEGVYPEYLYYFMGSPYFKKQIEYALIGAVQKALTMVMLKDVLVILPTLTEQRLIAQRLKNLDNIIKVNEAKLKKLESITQLIYDYWFTQFDFPDENGKPYRQSGGKMVYSKELKREIPDGWGVETLGDVCKIKLGGTPDTKNDAYWDGDIPWLSSAEIACNPVLSSEKYITEEGQKHSATEWSPSGSVALSITRYLRAAILGVDSCFNQSVVTLEENDLLKKEYLYPLVLSQIPRYMVLRTGAQQPHINKEVVAETIFVLPPMDVLNNYYKIVKPLYQKIITSAKKAKLLNELRDWLLPMLMNGQVKVS